MSSLDLFLAIPLLGTPYSSEICTEHLHFLTKDVTVLSDTVNNLAIDQLISPFLWFIITFSLGLLINLFNLLTSMIIGRRILPTPGKINCKFHSKQVTPVWITISFNMMLRLLV